MNPNQTSVLALLCAAGDNFVTRQRLYDAVTDINHQCEKKNNHALRRILGSITDGQFGGDNSWYESIRSMSAAGGRKYRIPAHRRADVCALIDS